MARLFPCVGGLKAALHTHVAQRWGISRITLGLLAITTVHVYLLPRVLEALPYRMSSETVRDHVNDWREREHGKDSWWPMAVAYEHWALGRPMLYRSIFFDGGIKFQYPPRPSSYTRRSNGWTPSPSKPCASTETFMVPCMPRAVGFAGWMPSRGGACG